MGPRLLLLVSALLLYTPFCAQGASRLGDPSTSHPVSCQDGERRADLILNVTSPSAAVPLRVRIEHYRLDRASQAQTRPVLLLSTRPVTPFGLWNSRLSDPLHQDGQWHTLGLALDEERQSSHYDIEVDVDFGVNASGHAAGCTITLTDIQP